jgi:hypothetical protein
MIDQFDSSQVYYISRTESWLKLYFFINPEVITL